VLALPASVGELWMVGYLLVRGVRSAARSADSDVGIRTSVAAGD
jgi:hypothetical protein